MAPQELSPRPRYTLPDDSVFSRLLHVSKKIQGHVIYDDHGFCADYPRILRDILLLRQALLNHLPKLALNGQGILVEKRRCICVLTQNGYEFIIAFFATLAIGGTCVPLGWFICLIFRTNES